MKMLLFLFLLLLLLAPAAQAAPIKCKEKIVVVGMKGGELEHCAAKSVTILDSEDIAIRDLTVTDTETLLADGLRIWNSKRVTVEDSTFAVPQGWGVVVDTSEDVTVKDSLFDHSSAEVAQSSSVRISGNDFNQAPKPVSIRQSDDTEISFNTIQGGIELREASRTNVSRNEILFDRVQIQQSGITLLEGNDVSTNEEFLETLDAGLTIVTIPPENKFGLAPLDLVIEGQDVRIFPDGRAKGPVSDPGAFPAYKWTDFPSPDFLQQIGEKSVTITPVYEGEEADGFTMKGGAAVSREEGDIPGIFTDDKIVVDAGTISGAFAVEGAVSGEIRKVFLTNSVVGLDFSTSGMFSYAGGQIAGEDAEIRIRQRVWGGPQAREELTHVVRGDFGMDLATLGADLREGASLLDVRNGVQITGLQETSYPAYGIKIQQDAVHAAIPIRAQVGDLTAQSDGVVDITGSTLSMTGLSSFWTNDVSFIATESQSVARRVAEDIHVVDIGGEGDLSLSGAVVHKIAPRIGVPQFPVTLVFKLGRSGVVIPPETQYILDALQENPQAAIFFRSQVYVNRDGAAVFSVSNEGLAALDKQILGMDDILTGDAVILDDLSPTESALLREAQALTGKEVVTVGGQNVIDRSIQNAAQIKKIEAVISYAKRHKLGIEKQLELRKAMLEARSAGFDLGGDPCASVEKILSLIDQTSTGSEAALQKARAIRDLCTDHTTPITGDLKPVIIDQRVVDQYTAAKGFPETRTTAILELANYYLVQGGGQAAYDEYDQLIVGKAIAGEIATPPDPKIISLGYLGLAYASSRYVTKGGAPGLRQPLRFVELALEQDPDNKAARDFRRSLRLTALQVIVPHLKEHARLLGAEGFRIRTGQKPDESLGFTHLRSIWFPLEATQVAYYSIKDQLTGGDVSAALDELHDLALKERAGAGWMYKLLESGVELEDLADREKREPAIRGYLTSAEQALPSDERVDAISDVVVTAFQSPDVLNLLNGVPVDFVFEGPQPEGYFIRERTIIPFLISTRINFAQLAMIGAPLTKVGTASAKLLRLIDEGITADMLTIEAVGRVTGVSKLAAKFAPLPPAARIGSEIGLPTAASLAGYIVDPVIGGLLDGAGLGFYVPKQLAAGVLRKALETEISKSGRQELVTQIAKTGKSVNKAKQIVREAGFEEFAQKLEAGTLKEAGYEDFLTRLSEASGAPVNRMRIATWRSFEAALVKTNLNQGRQAVLALAEKLPPQQPLFFQFSSSLLPAVRMSRKNFQAFIMELTEAEKAGLRAADPTASLEINAFRQLNAVGDRQLLEMFPGLSDSALLERARRAVFLNDVDIASKLDILAPRLKLGRPSDYLVEATAYKMDTGKLVGKEILSSGSGTITAFNDRMHALHGDVRVNADIHYVQGTAIGTVEAADLALAFRNLDTPVVRAMARDLEFLELRYGLIESSENTAGMFLFRKIPQVGKESGGSKTAKYYSNAMIIRAEYMGKTVPIHEAVHHLDSLPILDKGVVENVYAENFNVFKKTFSEIAGDDQLPLLKTIAASLESGEFASIQDFLEFTRRFKLKITKEKLALAKAGQIPELLDWQSLDAVFDNIEWKVAEASLSTPAGKLLGSYAMTSPEELIAEAGPLFFGGASFAGSSLHIAASQQQLKGTLPDLFTVFEKAFDPDDLTLRPEVLSKLEQSGSPLVSIGNGRLLARVAANGALESLIRIDASDAIPGRIKTLIRQSGEANPNNLPKELILPYQKRVLRMGLFTDSKAVVGGAYGWNVDLHLMRRRVFGLFDGAEKTKEDWLLDIVRPPAWAKLADTKMSAAEFQNKLAALFANGKVEINGVVIIKKDYLEVRERVITLMYQVYRSAIDRPGALDTLAAGKSLFADVLAPNGQRLKVTIENSGSATANGASYPAASIVQLLIAA